MVSVIPMKEKKLTDVKIRELPSWIPMADVTPKGTAGAFEVIATVITSMSM